MSAYCILTIEDDAPIRRGIVDALEFEGYRLLQADRGDSGLKLALSASYDLLLLDLVLPGLDGLEVLRHVREARPTLPIIILSARGEEADRIEGLRLGADDYVVKPFSVRELAARVVAVLRRSPERPNHAPRLPIPGGVADLSAGAICYEDGESIELTDRESEILRYLAGHAGRAISRDELMTRVWRLNPQGLHTRAIDMQIARLREKLRDNGTSPQLIRTVRGKGYIYSGAVSGEFS